jgi:hypothetical protein
MKNIYPKLILLFFCCGNALIGYSQCLGAVNGQYPAGTFSPTCTGVAQTITTCGYASEYSVVSVVNGNSYTFTSSVVSDVITIGNNAGTIAFATGTGSVTWTATVTANIRFYTHLAGCGAQSVCRTKNVSCNPPPCNNLTSIGTVAAPAIGATATISACQTAGSYGTVTGVVASSGYVSTSSVATDYITVRQGTPGGTVIATGTTPLTWNSTVAGTYFIHYNTNASCGTNASCRTSQIQRPACTNASAFATITAPTACSTPTTISTCSFGGEYSTINGVEATTNYTATSSVATDFITVHQGTFNGPIVAAGVTPLNWTSAVAGNYFLHWNTNPACGSQATCRTTTLTKTSNCPPAGCTDASQYPGSSFAAPTNNAPFTITTCQFQQEYNQMTGVNAGTNFTSTASIAGTFITIHQGAFNGPIITSGTTPLNWTSTVAGAYFIHYNTDGACGTASTCMTTTITCTSCPAVVVPPNDNCAGAISLGTLSCSGSTSVSATTAGATTEAVVPPGCGTTYDGNGIWYTITGNGNDYTANTCVSGYDTKLLVYTGSCGVFTCISGNDDFCGGTGLGSQASWTTTSGTTYFILVAGFSGATGTFTLGVQSTDVTAPSISCPGNISQFNTAGTCGSVVTYTPPVGTDNCAGATTAQIAGQASGSTFPVGVTTNTFRVTDAAGNTSTCSFTVTINDTQNPSISCPGNISQSNTAGTCGSVVTYIPPVGTDNCAGATTAQIAGQASGSTFPVGVTTNTFRVTDAAGNTSTCSFTVTINDTQNPSISCPGNISQSNTVGTCGSVVTYIPPVGTDNCPGATTAQIAGQPSGSTFPVGVTTNTFRVTDAAGNTSTCSFIVTITDAESPSISCPGNISQSNDAGTCGSVVTYVAPVGTDNCPGATTAQIAGQPSGSTFPIGVTTNTFRVTDAAGNTSTCSFTVSIIDAENPSISCPGNISTNNDPGICGATITYATPTGLDNCSGATTSLIAGQPSGTLFPLGTTTNTYLVTDVAGNSNTCSFTVTVTDNQLPNAACQNTTVILDATGNGSITVSDIDNGSTDNCGIATLVLSQTNFNCTHVGTNTITLTVTDVNGNSSSCSATVTVIDNTNPTAICQNVMVVLDGSGNGSTSAAAVNNGSNDACGIASMVLSQTNFTCANVGTTPVTLTVTDVNGNTSMCSATVTVVDNTPPVAPVISPVTGYCSVTIASAPTANDNCWGTVTGTTTDPLTYNSQGTFIITWTFTDGFGNSSTTTQTVIISAPEMDVTGNGNPINDNAVTSSSSNDTNFPIVSVCSGSASKTYSIFNNGINTLTITAVQLTGTNAADYTITSMPAATVSPGGSTTLTVSFNPSSSGFRLARVVIYNNDCNENPYDYLIQGVGGGNDLVGPVPNVATLPTITGSCTATVATVPTATDACTGPSTATTTSPLTYSSQGTFTVVWKYADGNGNTSTQNQTVIVQDVTAPVANCQTATVELNPSGTIDVPATMINNGSTDNCGGFSFIGFQNSIKIGNGQFNTASPLTSWTSGNGTMGFTTGGNPGGFALLNSTGAVGTDPFVQQTLFELVPGATYILRGDFRKPAAGNGAFPGQVAFAIDLDGVEIATKPLPNPVTAWTPFSVVFTATSTSHVIRLRGEINGTDGDIAVDNIRMDGTVKTFNCFTRGLNQTTLLVIDNVGNMSTCATTIMVNNTFVTCPNFEEADPSGADNHLPGVDKANIELMLYPNPSDGTFTLRLSDMPRNGATLRLMDNLGQMIYAGTLQSQSQSYDFSYLKAGTYYLQLIGDDINISRPIIITHQH